MAMACHHIAWQSYLGNDPRVLVKLSTTSCYGLQWLMCKKNMLGILILITATGHRLIRCPPVRDIKTFKECLGGSKGRPTYYPPVSNTEGWEIPALTLNMTILYNINQYYYYNYYTYKWRDQIKQLNNVKNLQVKPSRVKNHSCNAPRLLILRFIQIVFSGTKNVIAGERMGASIQ